MKAELTADQYAQRILTLADTLGLLSSSETAAKAKQQGGKPDASSISWAFHDSADSTGFLRWLVENTDAANNGLTASELALKEYLNRIDYQGPSGSQTKDDLQLGGGRSKYDGATSAFDLATQGLKLEKELEDLETHTNLLRSQENLLNSRIDQMTHEVSELLAEEEALEKMAKMSDSEAARLSSLYVGALEDTALTASRLMELLAVEGKTGGVDRYFYQCSPEIDRMTDGAIDNIDVVAQELESRIQSADELPSPWKEFRPFGTTTVSELLQLAADEHQRIGTRVSGMVRTKFELQALESLVESLDEEIDRRSASAEDIGVLSRQCREMFTASSSESVESLLSRHAATLAGSVLPEASLAVLPDVGKQLANLNKLHNELVNAQSQQVASALKAAESRLDPVEDAIGAVLECLQDENDMVSSWVKMWKMVSETLVRENGEMGRQKSLMWDMSSRASNSQVIHPDDTLALALKRLLTVSNAVLETNNVLSDCTLRGTKHSEQKARESLHSLELLLPDETSETTGLDTREQASWLRHGAFTSWDSLHSDAKTQKAHMYAAALALQTEAKTMAGIERQM
ncbi:hypothetical protein H4217_008056 [Coemansia sp. RSA 1939]|nr:hypothetical protein H4217_008056 [Coemansia sp. RSA 1939]KAJ2596834.1 hypothetical protein EV177_007859 [Coemansia sp. RSA 1804]KAJ2692149.1 hypothetical protein GGH99_001916 [Coemansia sp. RSA 1285]